VARDDAPAPAKIFLSKDPARHGRLAETVLRKNAAAHCVARDDAPTPAKIFLSKDPARHGRLAETVLRKNAAAHGVARDDAPTPAKIFLSKEAAGDGCPAAKLALPRPVFEYRVQCSITGRARGGSHARRHARHGDDLLRRSAGRGRTRSATVADAVARHPRARDPRRRA
jgi:hypothetical protein